MLIPPVPQNLPQRINVSFGTQSTRIFILFLSKIYQIFQCHLLRGRSLRKLEMYTEALMDFTEAAKLDPKNTKIEEEADEIRKIIENNGDTWKEEWETDLLTS